MFRDRDLLLRAVAALLPSRAGYRLTERLTPRLGGEPLRHVAAAVHSAAERLLGDAGLGRAAAERFAAAIACDDLDGLTAWGWPEGLRQRSVLVEGAGAVQAPEAAVFVSFHLSGGFRVFDVLRRLGFDPTFLCAPPRPGWSRYQRAIAGARLAHLRRTLSVPYVMTGPGAKRALESRLAAGGCIVALLDVAPGTLGLRDFGQGMLFGRALAVPLGLLRLAATTGVRVVPYDGRLEEGRRVLRFHAPVSGPDPDRLLGEVLSVFERTIRERPWDWQAWLEIESLFSPPGESRDVS
jgi:hypothetical protein